MKFGTLILRKIIKIVAARCHILKLKCIKFDFGSGSYNFWHHYTSAFQNQFSIATLIGQIFMSSGSLVTRLLHNYLFWLAVTPAYAGLAYTVYVVVMSD